MTAYMRSYDTLIGQIAIVVALFLRLLCSYAQGWWIEDGIDTINTEAAWTENVVGNLKDLSMCASFINAAVRQRGYAHRQTPNAYVLVCRHSPLCKNADRDLLTVEQSRVFGRDSLRGCRAVWALPLSAACVLSPNLLLGPFDWDSQTGAPNSSSLHLFGLLRPCFFPFVFRVLDFEPLLLGTRLCSVNADGQCRKVQSGSDFEATGAFLQTICQFIYFLRRRSKTPRSLHDC